MILHDCVVQQNRACVSDIKRNQCHEEGTGSASCNSAFVLHLGRFLDQEELMEREAMIQNS